MSLTPEQKAMRLQGISGSELAAVLGLSPWTRPVNVWERKLGLVDDDLSLNPNVIRGTLFERPVIQWYSLLSGRTVTMQGTIKHPKHPLIMATPDGIASLEGQDDVCLEIKCPTHHTARHWGNPGSDEIPEYYLPQVISQMAVTGLRNADVVLFSGIQPEIYKVAYDDELFHVMREQAEKFWHDHVLTRRPPPPDDSALYGEFLQRHMPQSRENETIDLTSNSQAKFWLEQLRSARVHLKESESIEEAAKNNLKALMGKHAYAKLDGAYLSWKNTKQPARVQWKELAKSAGIDKALIEQHTQLGEAPRPFKISWDK